MSILSRYQQKAAELGKLLAARKWLPKPARASRTKSLLKPVTKEEFLAKLVELQGEVTREEWEAKMKEISN